MNNLITEKESIIWASGHFQSQHLPDEYDEWKDEELNEHLIDFAWEPFQYHSADQIWDFILGLAFDFRETFNRKIQENEDEN